MAGLEGAGRRHHQAGEQAVLAGLRDRRRDWRPCGRGCRSRASLRRARTATARHAAPRWSVIVEAALLDFRDRIRRRRLDPVDLAGQQRRGAGIGLRHRQQHHLVDLGNARLVPIVVVLDQFEPLARREVRHLPRAGARGVLGERGPGGLRFRLGVGAFGRVKELLPFRRARHEQIGEIDRQEAVRLLGGQFHRHVVDLARRGQRRHARGGDADLAGVELRRVLLQHLVDVPDHGVGIERRAVVEGDAGTQLEGPLLLVGVVDLPFGREPGNHHARLVGRRQVPHRQRVIHGEAGEAVALKTLIGLARACAEYRPPSCRCAARFRRAASCGRPTDQRGRQQPRASAAFFGFLVTHLQQFLLDFGD